MVYKCQWSHRINVALATSRLFWANPKKKTEVSHGLSSLSTSSMNFNC